MSCWTMPSSQVLLTLEDDTRQALLVTPLWFIALGLGWLFIGKKRMAK